MKKKFLFLFILILVSGLEPRKAAGAAFPYRAEIPPAADAAAHDGSYTLTAVSGTPPNGCNSLDAGYAGGSISFTTNLPDGSYDLKYKYNNSFSFFEKSVTVSSGAFTLSDLGQGVYSNFKIELAEETVQAPLSTRFDFSLIKATVTAAASAVCSETGKLIFNFTDGLNGANWVQVNANPGISVNRLAASVIEVSVYPGTYSDFTILADNSCYASMLGTSVVVPPSGTQATLTPGAVVNPTICGSKDGSIAFSTNAADGDYLLRCSGDGNTPSSTSTVHVSGEAFTATGLGAGTYTSFLFGRVNGSCNAEYNTSITLTASAALTLSASPASFPTSCATANGSIDFTSNLPQGSYLLYAKRDGADITSPVTVSSSGTFTLSGLQAGVYTDFKINGIHCSGNTISVTLTAPSVSLSVGTVTQASCNAADGSIQFNIGLTGNYYYSLHYKKDGVDQVTGVNIANGSFTLTDLGAGTYSGFHFTQFACEVSTEQSVTLGATVLTFAGKQDPADCGVPNGSIRFHNPGLPGGNIFYISYKKDGLTVNQSSSVSSITSPIELNALPAGEYSDFSITHGACSYTYTGTVTLSDPVISFTLSAGTVTPPSSCAASDGKIAFTTTYPAGNNTLYYLYNGSPDYRQVTVTERNGAGSFELTPLAGGVYSGFTLWHGSCAITDNSSITVSAANGYSLILAEVADASDCAGGSITFETDMPAGWKNLTCSKDGQPLSFSVYVHCYFGSCTFSLTDLEGGVYSDFSITSAGCVSAYNTPITISHQRNLSIAYQEIASQASCTGYTGSLAFTTNLPNGNYPLAYKKDGQTGYSSVYVQDGEFTFPGLAPGLYSDFGLTFGTCTLEDHSAVNLPAGAGITLTAGNSTNPSGCGTYNGYIDFVTTGIPDMGSIVLRYKKNGEETTAYQSVQSNGFRLEADAGVYTDFRMEWGDCVIGSASSVTLSSPNGSTFTSESVTSPSSCGSTDGSIAFTSTLPDGNYTVRLAKNGVGSNAYVTISNGKFTVGNLKAGVYEGFHILTNQNCIIQGPALITVAPPAYTLTAGEVVNAGCGSQNGSIAFTTNIPDGSYTFSYKIDNTVASRQVTVSSGAFVLPDLGAATYSDFVINPDGCGGSDLSSKTVAASGAFTFAPSDVRHPSPCTSGSIAFNTNLPDGSYTLNYGIFNFSSFTVTAQPPATVTANSGKFTLEGLRAGRYINFSITHAGCTVSLGQSGPNAYRDLSNAGASSLAGHLGTQTVELQPGGNAAATGAEDCRLIAAITPGTAAGQTTFTVFVDGEVRTFSGKPYVQRHYEIAPATNGTGRVTLYFKQEEFNAYNRHASATDLLPTGPSHAAGISNLRINQFHGTGNPATGTPGSYSSGAEIIDPDDQDIVWNEAKEWWEVSFNVTGFSGFFVTAGDDGTLPVTLAGFEVRKEGRDALLSWSTTTETNFSHFDIERSPDAEAWQKIGRIAAKNPGTALTAYSYHDAHLSGGLTYYRLKMVDLDGSSTYSSVKSVKLEIPAFDVQVYPNPASRYVSFGNVDISRIRSVVFYSLTGQQVIVSRDIPKEGIWVGSLPSGIYHVHITGENQGTIVRKIVIGQ